MLEPSGRRCCGLRGWDAGIQGRAAEPRSGSGRLHPAEMELREKMTRKTSLDGGVGGVGGGTELQRENGRPRPGVGSVPVLRPCRGTAPSYGVEGQNHG